MRKTTIGPTFYFLEPWIKGQAGGRPGAEPYSVW
jgi:hypothetical protein